MVSILPQKLSPFQLIGKAMSDLGRNTPQLLENRFQTERGLGAIDQLQEALGKSGGDINKILPELLRAQTLNPALERSGLLPQYLQQVKAGISSDPVTSLIGGGGVPGLAANAATQAASGGQTQAQPQGAQSNIGVAAKGRTQPGIFLSDFIPQNIGELITPEQQAEMLSSVAKKGGDVNFTRQLIKDYNEGKIGFNELANSNIEKQAANVQRMLGFEDQIKSRIDKQLPPNTPEAEKNIYHNMVRDALEGTRSFTEAWQKVSSDIDNFRKLNEAYVNRIPSGLGLGLQGLNEGQEKVLRNSAKPILEKDPLAYNVLEQAFIEKGHSPITVSKTLAPTPKSVQDVIGKAGDFKDYIYPFRPMSDKQMLDNIDAAQEGQQKEIPGIVQSLRDNWSDEISLLNVYADLKKKGWMLPNILSIFDDIQDKFSSRQQADRATLNQTMRIPFNYLRSKD